MTPIGSPEVKMCDSADSSKRSGDDDVVADNRCCPTTTQSDDSLRYAMLKALKDALHESSRQRQRLQDQGTKIAFASFPVSRLQEAGPSRRHRLSTVALLPTHSVMEQLASGSKQDLHVSLLDHRKKNGNVASISSRIQGISDLFALTSETNSLTSNGHRFILGAAPTGNNAHLVEALLLQQSLQSLPIYQMGQSSSTVENVLEPDVTSSFNSLLRTSVLQTTLLQTKIQPLPSTTNISDPNRLVDQAAVTAGANTTFGTVAASASSKPQAVQQDSTFEQKRCIAQMLQTIGSTLRQRSDPYIDCAGLGQDENVEANNSLPDKNVFQLPVQSSKASKKCGVMEPFPQKLFRMLHETEEQGLTDIVSWSPHGRVFRVHQQDRFIAEIMPRYFQQTKWSSFTRQLNLWGFFRVMTTTSPDLGGYYSELFLRGHPLLCLYMKRVNTSTLCGRPDRRKFKIPVDHNVVGCSDPDFYAMKSLPDDRKNAKLGI